MARPTINPSRAPHATRLWRRASAQRAGLIVAAVVALLFLGVIGVLVSRAGKTTPPPGSTATPETPPDITSIPSGGGPAAASVLTGEGMFVQLMDKHDPSRLAGVIESAQIEPLENRRYLVEKPRVWIFLKDGKSLLVESRIGRLYMPDRTREPEAGTLEGDTTARLYAPKPGGARPDPAVDEPLLTAKADAIAFDGTIGEVTTEDDLTITSATTDFFGRGMRVLFNESLGRVELLQVRQNGRIVHRTGGAKPPRPDPTAPSATPGDATPTTQPTTSETAAATPAATDPTPAPQAPGPIETFYHAIFDRSVKAVYRGSELNADRLNVFARTLDNALAPNAIGRLETDDPPDQPTPPSPATDGAPPTPASDAPAPPPDPAAPTGVDELVLTWTGELIMRPTDARPTELTGEEVALRFESDAPSRVTITDAPSKADGDAGEISYGLTSRTLALGGPGGMTLGLSDSGSIRAGSLRVNLATGVASSPGAGELRGVADRSSSGLLQRVAWEEQADFTFLARNGRMTGAIKDAMFAGRVLATDGRGSLRAGFLRAGFEPPASEDESQSVLRRVTASEGVNAEDGNDGTLAARDLDAAFEAAPGTRNPSIRQMTARGDVVATRGVSALETLALSVDFEPGGEGRGAQPAQVTALGEVAYTGDGGVLARADELRADVAKQIADLSGEGTVVGKDNSRITGTQVRLDGLARSMEVFGPGRFEHTQPGHARPAVATWTKDMTFDDLQGRVIAQGAAEAVSYPDPFTRDTMRAERVQIDLTPGTSESGTTAEATPRELLAVLATGAVREESGGRPASIESRRYAEALGDGAEPTLARLMYLEGDRIEGDARAQRLTVPVPGRLLTVDRRQAASGEAEPSAGGRSPFAAAGSRGNALFEWRDRMVMDRPAGTMEMFGTVRLTHHRLGDAAATFLETAKLTAVIDDASAGQTGEVRGQLRSARAEGGVFARSGDKEMTADRLTYDAPAETILAESLGESAVTVIDPKTTSPLLARELFWDLRVDRLEVRRPMPVVTPR